MTRVSCHKKMTYWIPFVCPFVSFEFVSRLRGVVYLSTIGFGWDPVDSSRVLGEGFVSLQVKVKLGFLDEILVLVT